VFEALLCPWCGWGFWPFSGWGMGWGGWGILWFLFMMLFWILLLALLVAGVVYVVRYLMAAPRRAGSEELEAEIKRLKSRIEELERERSGGR